MPPFVWLWITPEARRWGKGGVDWRQRGETKKAHLSVSLLSTAYGAHQESKLTITTCFSYIFYKLTSRYISKNILLKAPQPVTHARRSLKNCLLEAWQPPFRILVPVDDPKVPLVEDSLAKSGRRMVSRSPVKGSSIVS